LIVVEIVKQQSRPLDRKKERERERIDEKSNY